MWLNNCNWNSIHYLKNLEDLNKSLQIWFVICGAKSFFLRLVNSKVTFHYSKRLVQSRVQYCKQQQKKQVSLQAQLYNKNIKLTIDKQEKYRTWIMGEQLRSQKDTLA